MIYRLIKAVLFLFPAETAHHLTTRSFVILIRIPIISYLIKSFYKFEDPSLERELWGIHFKNPVGLAAGFDKDGQYIDAMSALGFGFIELGTVTPRPQIGNPKPRLFRLIEDKAIINRMGFNNNGVKALSNRLKARKKTSIIIGGNIGKNKTTPNENAFEDYLICFKELYDHVDYFVVNLSSPNTPGLRSLQEKGPLTKILSTLTTYRSSQTTYRPILLKIAPDLTDPMLQDVVDIVSELEIEGIISTNTTIARSTLVTSEATIKNIGNGGLSGAPLTASANEITKKVISFSGGNIPVIGVGGIHNAGTAKERIASGASLIQIYSGLIYEGPSLIKRIKKSLLVK